MTTPIETQADEVDSNIVYEIYELNPQHWNYSYFAHRGTLGNYVVYVRYLDDQYKHYAQTPVATITEAQAWIGREISERKMYEGDAVMYKGHKIKLMTEFQTGLVLCGILHPERGYVASGPKANFGAINIETMMAKIDEYISPEREIAVENARRYFEKMLHGDMVTTNLADGCHYCGAKAVSFDIFDAPVCAECGGR